MARDLVWQHHSARFSELMAKESLSPEEVKEALIECFITAVGGDRELALLTLKNQFRECGVPWDKPTRDGLLCVVKRLRTLSKKFRDEDVVERNFHSLMALIGKCRCD